jgi:hypothetical protein
LLALLQIKNLAFVPASTSAWVKPMAAFTDATGLVTATPFTAVAMNMPPTVDFTLFPPIITVLWEARETALLDTDPSEVLALVEGTLPETGVLPETDALTVMGFANNTGTQRATAKALASSLLRVAFFMIDLLR